MKLTTDSYWNAFWSPAEEPELRPSRLPRWVTEPFADHTFRCILRRLLHPGASVIELGSAPGRYLVGLQRDFGIDAWGVDYSPVGVAENRRIFAQAGLKERQVIESDVFAPEFQHTYESRFDVVLSRGFIEHFTDAGPAIAAHARLARPGGWVVIQIPNYHGLNYILKRCFAPGNLPAHNLEMMHLCRFQTLFACSGLEARFCEYLGTCQINMAQPQPGRESWRLLYELCDKAQLLLNALLYVTCHTRGPEASWLSPYLVFVGNKPTDHRIS